MLKSLSSLGLHLIELFVAPLGSLPAISQTIFLFNRQVIFIELLNTFVEATADDVLSYCLREFLLDEGLVNLVGPERH